MNESKVGIIVLNWNGLSDTRDCLNSLLAMNGESIIYVVDNGSTDGSVEVLNREFGDKIILIANSRNLLYAGGNNIGIRRALADKCSHILLLNNDTTVDQEMQSALLDAWKEIGNAVFCPKIYYMGDRVIWYAGGRLSLSRARIPHRGIREQDRGQYDQMEKTDWATGCALFAPSIVFETVGLLDESFGLYYEDVDFSLRAREKGFPTYYVPKAVVWHKVSAAIGGNLSIKKMRRKFNGLKKFMKKYVKNDVKRMMALLDFMITETIRVAFAALRGKLS